jgi:sterol desaturase/sphingolipid hydroxylase (fatty acid hydroxylase superfamily)
MAHGLLRRMQKVIAWWSLEAMLLYPFVLLLIFALERRYPAIPRQKTLSTGLVHDALWVLIEAVAAAVMIHWYSRVVYKLYSQHLGFLTLPFARSLPEVARLGIGAVALDFGRWCQHWLHHNVRWLWPFHALHHSQRELNLFSDYRVHLVEYFVRYAIMVFPMLLLGVQAPSLIWWTLLLSWHARLYHANVRMNFGPLRYIFVTPQSHRIHHSREREHYDLNYGAMLSIWDYLFRTQYRRYDVYPETGIDDEKFPGETAQSVAGVLTAPLRQMLYPFRQLWPGRKGVGDVAAAMGPPPAESSNA